MITKKLHLHVLALALAFLLPVQAYGYKAAQHGVSVSTKDGIQATEFIEQTLKLSHVDYAAKGIRPVLLGIANNTNKPITVSPMSFNVPVLASQEIASRCWHKWKSVSLGFLMAGTVPLLRDVEKVRFEYNSCNSPFLGDQDDSFWWALHKIFFSYDDYFYSHNLSSMNKKLFYLGALATPLYWWYADRYNKNIDSILQEFILHQAEVIQPGETLEKIAFFDATQLADVESLELHIHAHDEVASFAITK